MIFRYARHTNDLNEIKKFYHDFLELELIGEFHDHEGYDGLFFGKEGLDWHLEFTTSKAFATHQPNADDLLVFYFENQEEIDQKWQKAMELNLKIRESENPYWQRNGVELEDPDGFGVILTQKKT